MSLRAAPIALLLAGTAAAAPADDEVGRRLQEALRAQRGEVHRCYGLSLDKNPRAQGEVLVRLIMGPGGKVRSATILKDQTDAPGLAACLEASMAAWTLPGLGASPGDVVAFPLVFRPEDIARPGPRVLVHGASVPELAAGKCRVRIYFGADDPSAQASLSDLSCPAGAEVPLHQHDTSDEVLYILSGRGRMTAGDKQYTVSAGDAVRLPRGLPHGLTVLAPLRAIQSYAPPGPEQRFRARAKD